MAQTDTQTVRAQAKWVRTSARKARVVAEHIRGRSVPDARAVLAFTPRAAARDIEKVLRSAVANAESRPDLQWHGDELVVSAVYVDEGPTLKRWRARARGRVARIRKRTCHITLVLEQAPEPAGGATMRGRRSRAEAPAQAETKRRLPTPRRAAKPKAERRDRDRDRARGRGSCRAGSRRGAGGSTDTGRAAGRGEAQAEASTVRPPQEDRRNGEGELVGQKVHPGGMRVGVIHDWKSNWYVPNKDFAGALLEDVRIREHIYKKLSHAGLSDILIRKDNSRITIDIYTARPGIVIGKSGVEVDALRREIHALTHKNVQININEIKRPELDAKLVAQSIAEQLQNRVSFRRAMKRSLASAMRSGAHGVKVQCGGRLGGAEMSRSESYSEGRVPLHTIRADIDYGFAEAKTTFGRIGVKVWINKGEIMPEGFEGLAGGRELRLGDQDQARRRRGAGRAGEGLGQREGRRGPDREGLGPVRRRRPGRGGGRPRGRTPETAEQADVEQTQASADETTPRAEAPAPEPTATTPETEAKSEETTE